MSDENNTIDNESQTIPTWYTPVTVVALIWNLLGFMAFVSHLMMTPETIATLPPAEQELYTNAPGWLIYAFGIAVIGGSLGSLGLVMKKIWAIPLLEVSLLGVLAQNYHTFFASNSIEVLGQAAIGMPIMVIIIAVLLIILGFKMKNKGVLA